MYGVGNQLWHKWKRINVLGVQHMKILRMMFSTKQVGAAVLF
jgi:hypothetical protein